MSASDEWTDWHLTPGGWVKGSSQIDFAGAKHVDPPADRVATYRYYEYLSSAFSKMDRGHKLQWECDDKASIKALMDRHPGPPAGIVNAR